MATIEHKHDHLDEKQFVLAVKRLADSLAYGADSSPFLGGGIDYVQSREYSPGDPVKSIDWRVTARTGKHFVKEYEAPKQMPVYMVMDTSASMCVSSQLMSKYAWGVQIATGLALVAQNRMSPVGLMGCGARANDLHFHPSLCKDTVMRWSHELRYFNLAEGTSLGLTLRRLQKHLSKRSLVVVISDLYDSDALPSLKLIDQEHDCIVLLMQDPSELGLKASGFFRAQEAESDEVNLVRGANLKRAVDVRLDTLKNAGIDSLLLRIDYPVLAPLRQFLKHRDIMGKSRL